MTALVEASDLVLAYDSEPALSDVSFEAGEGQSVAVLGPNGGGKTTLFRALVGELRPRAGSVAVAERPAYVAQGARTRLDFPVSALDVAVMGTIARSAWWLPPSRADRRAAAAALRRLGLEHEAGTRFGELSGGQRQRVLLARALAQDSRVLILDEPLAGVDPASAELIGALFDELRGEDRLLLVATHDAAAAGGFDRVLCLNRRQVAFGRPADCLSPEILEATYGSEIVLLETSAGPVRAIAVQHHEH